MPVHKTEPNDEIDEDDNDDDGKQRFKWERAYFEMLPSNW